jgi:chemotaxis protein MotB
MARKHRKPTQFHEVNYWQSYSDMMAGVLLMFILIICGTLFGLMQVKNSYDASEIALQEREDELEQAILENLDYSDLTEAQNLLLDAQKAQLDEQQAALDEAQAQLDEQQAALDEAQAQLQDKEDQITSQQTALAAQQAQLEEIIGVKKDLIAALSDAFSHTDLSISIDQQTGAITMDSSVMFDYNSDELSADGQATLSTFLPEYFAVVLSDEYIDYVSEIIIEGHTDTVGTYTYNLELSQARAEAVAAYCLGDDQNLFSQDMLDQIRSLVSVGGRSWSVPIYNDDGTVDADASRRVEIQFRLSDEEMITQLADVLGQYEP